MMINFYNDDIRLTDPNRHKFDSAMAQWLYYIEPDDYTGSLEWDSYVSLFGKRILIEDDRGFVSCVKFPTVERAIEEFERIDCEYAHWLSTEESV